MTCCHHWRLGQPTYKGDTMVTPAACKWCPATREFREQYKPFREDVFAEKPLWQRLGVI